MAGVFATVGVRCATRRRSVCVFSFRRLGSLAVCIHLLSTWCGSHRAACTYCSVVGFCLRSVRYWGVCLRGAKRGALIVNALDIRHDKQIKKKKWDELLKNMLFI